MKKKYIKPNTKVIPVDAEEMLAGSNNKGNNKGNHYGWDNPHNPHNPQTFHLGDELN